MRIRVQAADGTVDGDIVEAGIDDVQIIGYVAGAPPQITDLVALRMGNNMLLSWSDPGGVTFNVYRSTDPGFVPTPGDLIANVAVPNYADTNVLLSSNHYFYRVTAVSGMDAQTAGSQRQSLDRNVR
jgi:hypothetical protein